MTRIKVKAVVWDKANLEHIKKHHVSPKEVEESGKEIVYHRKTKENRFLAVGRSSSRIITLIIKRLGLGKYYLVTARDASKKERKVVYERKKS